MGFESAIHQLRQGARGSRNRPEQMIRAFLVSQAASTESQQERTFQTTVELPELVAQLHPEAAQLAIHNDAVSYQGRCLLRGRTIFSIMYTRGSARSSHFLHYCVNGDNSFGEAVFFFTDGSGEMFCVVKQLEVLTSLFDRLHGLKQFPHACKLAAFHFVCQESEIYCCISLVSILTRCCVLREENVYFISPIIHDDFELQ